MIIKEKILFAIDELNTRLIERDQLIKITILAMFSKAHMFLIGERGVAKSLTIRLLENLIGDAKYWELQVGTDTEARQLFGEKRVADDGTTYYHAKNTVLDAHIIFLDEMFKAKTEILNMLLQIMADKYYTTGDGKMIDVPLIFLIGASNEYPMGSLAEPYLDRLLFWYDVERIQDRDKRLQFFNSDFNTEPIEKPIFTLDEIEDVYKASKAIKFTPETLEKFNSIVDLLILQGVKTSDRKYRNSIKSMQVSAYINGRDTINYSDIFLLIFTSWHNDVEKRKVDDVVFFEMFSNNAKLGGFVKDIRDRFKKIDTFYKGNLYDFSNHLVSFLGNSAEEDFIKYRDEVYTCLNAYDELYSSLYNVKGKIDEIYFIEKQIDENIFFSTVENNSITNNILDEIKLLENEITTEWTNIKKWVEMNNTLSNYNKIKERIGT